MKGKGEKHPLQHLVDILIDPSDFVSAQWLESTSMLEPCLGEQTSLNGFY